MKYLDRLKWYSKVWWDERRCFIDCLVDTSQQDTHTGHWLVEQEGYLVILHIRKIHTSNLDNKIGRVLKRDCRLNCDAEK